MPPRMTPTQLTATDLVQLGRTVDDTVAAVCIGNTAIFTGTLVLVSSAGVTTGTTSTHQRPVYTLAKAAPAAQSFNVNQSINLSYTKRIKVKKNTITRTNVLRIRNWRTLLHTFIIKGRLDSASFIIIISLLLTKRLTWHLVKKLQGHVTQTNKKLSYRRETARQLCIGWLTDRAMHRTPQNRRGCTISDIQTL